MHITKMRLMHFLNQLQRIMKHKMHGIRHSCLWGVAASFAFKNSATITDNINDCKTLLFSGAHEAKESCDAESPIKHNEDYSVALASALIHADGVFQPMLMLGGLGVGNRNSTEHATFGSWTEGKDTKIIQQSRSSFQQDLFWRIIRISFYPATRSFHEIRHAQANWGTQFIWIA